MTFYDFLDSSLDDFLRSAITQSRKEEATTNLCSFIVKLSGNRLFCVPCKYISCECFELELFIKIRKKAEIKILIKLLKIYSFLK